MTTKTTKTRKPRNVFLYKTFFVCFVFSCVSWCQASAEILDRVLAVVGGDVITLSDVTAARDLGLQSTESAADPVRAVLSKLIDRELILVEVERYAPPEPPSAAVDAEVAKVRARFPSADAFNAALTRSGIDEKHLRETLRQDLRIRSYEDQRFAAAGDRRDQLIAEWVANLRRRGDIMDLYLPTTRN